ncbi:metallophosphoesterase [bacterium]|nr:metallophosphoesterase [bacterium]
MKKIILTVTAMLIFTFCNHVFAKDTTSPGKIKNLTAITGVNDGEIELKFTAPGDDGYSAADTLNGTYFIQYSTKSNAVWNCKNAQVKKIIKDVNYGETNKLVVAMLGDTQFGFPTGVDPEPSLSNAVFTMMDLSNLTHDFFIVAGDLIQPNVNFWPYHHKYIEGMAARPQYFIAGNAERYLTLENYAKETGFPIGGYTVEKRGIRFIFLNTAETSGKTAHICHVGEEQMKWLVKELASNTNITTFILFHAPMLNSTHGSHKENEFYMKESAEMRNLFKKNPNIVFIGNGHMHHQYTTPPDPNGRDSFAIESNVFYVSLPRPPQSFFVEIYNDEIIVRPRNSQKKVWESVAAYGSNHTVSTTLTPKELDNQELTISDLTPGQTYYLKVWTMDESSNISEQSIVAVAAAKKLPPTAPDKPKLPFIENAAADINTNIIDSTPEFSAIFNDANIFDTGKFYEIEVEKITNTVIDEFNDNDFSAYSFGALTGISESNGAFSATSVTADPFFWKNLSPPINGSDFNTVIVRMKTDFKNPFLTIYWENEDGGFDVNRKATSSSVRTEGDWNLYFVDLKDHKSWMGKTIKKLRIDPFDLNNKSVEVDYIKILSANGSGINVWSSGKKSMPSLAIGKRTKDISYDGIKLETGNLYNWRMKFWDSSGLESPWCDWSTFYYSSKTL